MKTHFQNPFVTLATRVLSSVNLPAPCAFGQGTAFSHLWKICVALVLITSALSLKAAVLTVTSLADAGAGSLRQQIGLSSPGDTIQFAVSGTILLSSSISIPQTLTVQGPGPAALTVDAGGHDRAFIVAGGTVVISGMTISNGVVTAANGNDGSIFHDGQYGGEADGGAILDTGFTDILILSNCWVTGNTVVGGNGGRGGNDFPSALVEPPGKGGQGGNAAGGAVFSQNIILNINCTFSHNRAVAGQGGNGGDSENPDGTGGVGEPLAVLSTRHSGYMSPISIARFP